MTDQSRHVSSLRRPRLLVRAARVGINEYKRERDLCRLMQTSHVPSPENAVASLLSEEEVLESTRRTGDTAYSVLRHVEILIALMAESRLLGRSSPAAM